MIGPPLTDVVGASGATFPPRTGANVVSAAAASSEESAASAASSAPLTTATPSSVAGSYFSHRAATRPLALLEGEHARDLGVEVVVEHDAVLGRELHPVARPGQREVRHLRAAHGVDHGRVAGRAVGHEDVPPVLGERPEVGGAGCRPARRWCCSRRDRAPRRRRCRRRARRRTRGRWSATRAGVPRNRVADRRTTSHPPDRPDRAATARAPRSTSTRTARPSTSTSWDVGRRQVRRPRAWRRRTRSGRRVTASITQSRPARRRPPARRPAPRRARARARRASVPGSARVAVRRTGSTR